MINTSFFGSLPLLGLSLLACLTVSALSANADDPKPIALWQGVAPGDKDANIGTEKDTTETDANGKPKDDIIRLGKVTQPTIEVYRPAKNKANGAAVLVCPGGGYSILAMNLEGTEVCKWLNSIGVTAILLKYRVPGRTGLERHAAALQDSQRALGMVRNRAKEFDIDPKRIGILGFSAGGHLAAATSNSYETRTYPAVDAADKVSCRPDFTVLIYPAYLMAKDDIGTLAPEIKVTPQTPSAFVAMTQDDPVKVENAYAYTLALHKVKVPVELHVYPTGGHGYGLRPTKHAVSHWNLRLAEWLTAQGWLEPKA